MTAKKLTAKIETELMRRLQRGETLSRISHDINMPSRETVNRWQRGDDDFDDGINRARREGAWCLFDRSMDLLDNCRTDEIQVVREKMTHLRWCMTKMAPEEFGDSTKLRVEKVEPVYAQITWMDSQEAASDVIEHDRSDNVAAVLESAKVNEETLEPSSTASII